MKIVIGSNIRLLVIATLCLVQTAFISGGPLSAANLEREMKSAFAAFEDPNVLIDPINFASFDAFIKNFDAYITDKITVKIIGLDKEISAEYGAIKGKMYDMINALKVLRNAYVFKPAKTAQDKKTMVGLAKKFEIAADAIKANVPKLDKIRSKLVLSNKKEAVDALRLLCNKLENVGYDLAMAFSTYMLEVD